MGYWLRLYTDILDDRKVQKLKPELFKAWINLLCLAKEQDGFLPDISDIAFRLRIEDREAEELVAALMDDQIGLLERKGEQIKPHNWEGRQYASDTQDRTAAERARKYRANKRHGTVTRDATVTRNRDVTRDARNVTVTEQKQSREQSRAETEKQKQSRGDIPATAAAKNGTGLYATESHASQFSFEQIKTYCEAVKRRAENSGGLARMLYRTGEEDADIARWIEQQERRARLSVAPLDGPNDDFGIERVGEWGKVMDLLEAEIGHAAVATWFEPLRFDAEAQVLTAPDPLFIQWIESNYKESFMSALALAGIGNLTITTKEELCESSK